MKHNQRSDYSKPETLNCNARNYDLLIAALAASVGDQKLGAVDQRCGLKPALSWLCA